MHASLMLSLGRRSDPFDRDVCVVNAQVLHAAW
jgi:hypothetical protein